MPGPGELRVRVTHCGVCRTDLHLAEGDLPPRRPDVVPGQYSARLKRGDWVIVCSDGLTNHVPTADLEKMLRETYGSAEDSPPYTSLYMSPRNRGGVVRSITTLLPNPKL